MKVFQVFKHSQFQQYRSQQAVVDCPPYSKHCAQGFKCVISPTSHQAGGTTISPIWPMRKLRQQVTYLQSHSQHQQSRDSNPSWQDLVPVLLTSVWPQLSHAPSRGGRQRPSALRPRGPCSAVSPLSPHLAYTSTWTLTTVQLALYFLVSFLLLWILGIPACGT